MKNIQKPYSLIVNYLEHTVGLSKFGMKKLFLIQTQISGIFNS